MSVFEEKVMAAQNPVLQGTASGPVAVQRRSWFGRNWKWLLLVVFLTFALLVMAVFLLIMGAMRSSDVAKEAVARAQGSRALVQRLGTPINEGWVISGSINVAAGGTGDADLAVPVTGPQGKATLYVTARKSGGTWNYSQMQAAIEGTGERIDLLAASALAQLDAVPDTAAPPNPAAETGGASAPDPAATPRPTSATDGLGSGDGEQAGTKVVINDLKRGGSTVMLKFTIYNDSNVELGVGMRFKADGYRENGGRSFSGLHLIDSVSKKKYFVASDSDGNCLCSEHVDDIGPKTQASLWAKFPAPPDNVQKITVEIPHFIPVDDVPIR